MARASASAHAGWFGINARTEAVMVPLPTPAPLVTSEREKLDELEDGRHIGMIGRDGVIGRDGMRVESVSPINPGLEDARSD